jgi:cytochrome c oxidase subunit 4
MSSDSHGHGIGHVVPIKTLLGVLIALLLLTGLTYWTGRMDFHGWDLKIAMVIATVKASLVCLIFMHLKWDKPLNATLFFIALIFVGIFLAYTVTDTFEYEMNVDALLESQR